MASLMDKILSFFTGQSKYITQGKRRFSENQYYNFNYDVYALHEISHAVSLRLYDDYQSIEDKSIVIKKEKILIFPIDEAKILTQKSFMLI